MFPKQARYKTQGIKESIPEHLQDALWAIIDGDLDEGKPMDYLQMFTLTVDHPQGQASQRIQQQQEHPKSKRTHEIIGLEELVSDITIWVFDSGTYCTMLLPIEY